MSDRARLQVFIGDQIPSGKLVPSKWALEHASYAMRHTKGLTGLVLIATTGEQWTWDLSRDPLDWAPRFPEKKLSTVKAEGNTILPWEAGYVEP